MNLKVGSIFWDDINVEIEIVFYVVQILNNQIKYRCCLKPQSHWITDTMTKDVWRRVADTYKVAHPE
jgi:hypothetical protein